MILTAAEKQVIVAVKNLEMRNGMRTVDELNDFGRMFFCSYKLDWELALPALLRKGVIDEENGQFRIMEALDGLATDLVRKYPRFRYWYNDWYRLAGKSKAHSRLCEMAYGIDLCQTGMMTLKQLQFMTENFVQSGKTGLDLGCGIGNITEYIVDQCSCKMTGIDPIVFGIRRARQRTAHKKAGLTFQIGDMTSYFRPGMKYAAIFSLDTIYFVGDKYGEVVLDALQALHPHGKLLVFYSAWDPKDSNLEVHSTQLANFLNQNKIPYQSFDFTRDEREHWRKKHRALLELKECFLEERNELIYENRLMEAEGFAKMADADKLFRYFYVIG